MAKRATRRQQRSVDSSVDEIAAIPRSQRQFRTADHPLLSRLLRESSRENTIAILRLSTLLSPLIICQSLLVSVSFDDHASSVPPSLPRHLSRSAYRATARNFYLTGNEERRAESGRRYGPCAYARASGSRAGCARHISPRDFAGGTRTQ